MAQKSTARPNQRNTSSRKAPAQPAKRPKSGTSSRAQQQRIPQPEEEKESILALIWSNHWGRMLYALIGIMIIIALDFLISMNHYDLFFTILGVEIVVGMVIGWIVYLVVSRRKNASSDEITGDSEE
jgi:hypothetical protein